MFEVALAKVIFDAELEVMTAFDPAQVVSRLPCCAPFHPGAICSRADAKPASHADSRRHRRAVQVHVDAKIARCACHLRTRASLFLASPAETEFVNQVGSESVRFRH